MTTKRIKLGWPPSVNLMYRSIRGRNILSKKARDYKAKWGTYVIGSPEMGPVKLTVLLHPPKNFKYDVDNYFKMPLDLLKTKWFNDDSQVQDLRGVKRKKDLRKEGYIIIIMEAICQTQGTTTGTGTGG